MVDYLHRDPHGLGCVEGARGVAVERGPGIFVDFGLESGFQGFVGIVGAEKVGVADEEGLFVVVGVDEPAGDAVSVVGADFAGVGVKDVDAFGYAIEIGEEVELLRFPWLACFGVAQQVIDQHLGVHLFLNVDRRGMHHQIGPVLLILAPPD